MTAAVLTIVGTLGLAGSIAATLWGSATGRIRWAGRAGQPETVWTNDPEQLAAAATAAARPAIEARPPGVLAGLPLHASTLSIIRRGLDDYAVCDPNTGRPNLIAYFILSCAFPHDLQTLPAAIRLERLEGLRRDLLSMVRLLDQFAIQADTCPTGTWAATGTDVPAAAEREAERFALVDTGELDPAALQRALVPERRT